LEDVLDAVLMARNLSKSFGGIQAVRGLSLQVRPGEIFGLVGPDGAGKTTTMRLLCGAMAPDAGEVEISGIPLARYPDRAREHIGYLSQRFSLYADLTVLENLRFFAEVRGIPSAEWRPRSMEILAFVGLAEFTDRRAAHLSGGMRQKLGLATALVHQPRLLLLDEPTGGVDPVTRQDFWQLIIRLVSDEGVSVLVSTPYMDEAVRCTYVGFMSAGELLVADSPNNLRNLLRGRVLELRGGALASLAERLAGTAGVEEVRMMGGRLRLRCAAGMLDRVKRDLEHMRAAAEIEISGIQLAPPGLEDVFNLLLEAGGIQEVESGGKAGADG
jgi:ABC-2 type transport system ATP-binding protein